MQKKFLWVTTILLAFIGGFLNAYSFYYRGGKYAFLQTGNIITMIYDSFFANYQHLYLGILSFLSFYLGVCFTYVLKQVCIHFHQERLTGLWLVLIDFVLLVPSLFFTETIGVDLSWISIFLLGLIGGSLIECFRRLLVHFSSTMMTNNTKLMLDYAMEGIRTKNKRYWKKSAVFLAILASFIAGVIAYMIFYKYGYAQWSVFVPLACFLIILVIEVEELVWAKNRPVGIGHYLSPSLLSNQLEEEVNELCSLDESDFKNKKSSFEAKETAEALRSGDEQQVIENELAKKLYMLHLLEQNKTDDLKTFLKKM